MIKSIMKILSNVLCMGINLSLILSCSAFGTAPHGEHLEKIKKSPQYNKEKEQFQNRRPEILEQMRGRFNILSLYKEFLFGTAKRIPSTPLPEIKPPDMASFLEKTDSVKFIWFGHSTLLVNFQNTIIMFDPVLSGSASPFRFAVKRFQPPVLKIEELPEIDYVLISHDHYDHLDEDTIKSFINKKTKFITPLGVTSHIRGWGIPDDRLTELDWWESTKINNLEIICTPAQHFSGRTGMTLTTLWSSWILRSDKNSMFFSGDSGYDIHFKDIGDRYGPFDIAFIENGQYNTMWQEVHVLPEETIKAFFDLKAKKMAPIHQAMFDLSLHRWYEPIVALDKLATEKKIFLLTPELGQLFDITGQSQFSKWWLPFIKENAE